MSTPSSNAVSWPWGNEPPPEAVHRLRIKSQIFQGDTYPPSTFPGTMTPTSYFRFSGTGPPPHEIGKPGDIYVDNSELLALYGRDQIEWAVWPGPGLLFRHPTLDDRYLWCSEERIAWYPGKFVVEDAKARSGQTLLEMIQQALKSEAKGLGILATVDDAENRRPRKRAEKVRDEENQADKRTPSDRMASEDSERAKRQKIHHDEDHNVQGALSRQAGKEGETERKDSGISECLSETTDDEERQCSLQKEAALVNEHRGWWLDAVAQMCRRCPLAEARASTLESEKRLLEATVRVFEERLTKEERERHRLAKVCEDIMTERKDSDSEKVAAENRNLECLHQTLREEIETLRQKILALTRKVSDDEKVCLELQEKNTRLEQEITLVLGENEKLKTIQDTRKESRSAESSVTPETQTSTIPKIVLDCLPGHVGQTLAVHLESLLAMAQESAEVSKSAQDARQKITSMEEHISKVTSERDESLVAAENLQRKLSEMQKTLKMLSVI